MKILETGTIPDIANQVGCNKTTLYRARKKKPAWFIFSDDGKNYDIKKTVASLKKHGWLKKVGIDSQPMKKERLKKHDEKRGQPKIQLPEVSQKAKEYNEHNPPPALSRNLGSEELEKIKLYEQARKLNIENNVKEKKYLLAEDIQHNNFMMARKIRDSILKIPGIVSSVVPDDIRHDIEILADKQLKECLEILAAELENKEY